MRARRRLFTVLLAVTMLGMVVLAVVLLTTKTKVPPPAASISASDRAAPQSLVQRVAAVGFYPTTSPGLGRIESQPASAAHPPANSQLLPVGSKAPAFTLRTPVGDQVSLGDFRGKATLVEFFATWCPHCNVEAPHLERLYASLPTAKYAFVSVNADGETAPSVFAFHVYYGLRFPALLDPSSSPGDFHSPGGSGPVTTGYHVRYFPTFYVLDPQGRIAWRSDGEQPDALLRRELVRAAGSARK